MVQQLNILRIRALLIALDIELKTDEQIAPGCFSEDQLRELRDRRQDILNELEMLKDSVGLWQTIYKHS